MTRSPVTKNLSLDPQWWLLEPDLALGLGRVDTEVQEKEMVEVWMQRNDRRRNVDQERTIHVRHSSIWVFLL